VLAWALLRAGLRCRGGAAARCAGVVDRDGVEQVFGDLLGVVLDGQDRCAAHELGQAADHAAAAAVEVLVERDQRAWVVLVQPQHCLQCGHQCPPGGALFVGAVGERGGADEGEPAGDLPAPHPGE
jgi:hypothetical protein